MFSFACDPERGSEPGAGWAAVEAAAQKWDVTVVTRTGDAPTLEARCAALPRPVTVIRAGSFFDRFGTYVRYMGWIVSAARAGRRAHTKQRFDVLHHTTYASDWLPSPLALMRPSGGTRFIWGPVGGATYPPRQVVRAFSSKSQLSEWARAVQTRLFRFATIAALRRRVDVAIAMNRDTSSALRRMRSVVIRPNAVVDYERLPQPKRPAVGRLVYAGRGLEWKGLGLSIDALAYLGPDWTIDVLGPGTDDKRWRDRARPHSDRVNFHGSLPRQEALQLVAEASVFLLPSAHDSAGWAAAEAAGMGVPVVALDLGGVAEMAGPLCVQVGTDEPGAGSLARRVADGVLMAAKITRNPWRPWTRDAYVRFLEDVYLAGDAACAS